MNKYRHPWCVLCLPLFFILTFNTQVSAELLVHPKAGIWANSGADVYIEIEPTGASEPKSELATAWQITYYELSLGSNEVGSQNTCIKLFQTNDLLQESLPLLIDDFQRSDSKKDEISYENTGGLFSHRLHQVPKLPLACLTPMTLPSQYIHRPDIDFDIFWNQYNHRYAAFKRRGISQALWNQRYREYKAKAIATKDGDELFQLLSQLLRLSFNGESTPSGSSTQQCDHRALCNKDYNERALDGTRIQADSHVALTAHLGLKEWRYKSAKALDYKRRYALLENPMQGYLENLFDISAFKPLLNKGGIWGVYSLFAKIKGQKSGYLLLNTMIDFEQGKAANRSINDYKQQSIAVSKWMESVIDVAKQQKLNKIIIDLRNNMGGFDQISLQIAAYFTAADQYVFSKRQRVGGTIDLPEWTDEHQQKLVSAVQPFQGDIVLLTSRHTVSAAEVFVLAMKDLPKVTIIGEPTAGALSDILQRRTSNGWLLELSHELYWTKNIDGQDLPSREGLGLEPDIILPYHANDFYPAMTNYRDRFFARKDDLILEKALQR